MTRQELLNVLQTSVNDVLGNQSVMLTPKTKLKNISVTSFALVQLICSVEDACDVEISNAELRSFRTVNDILDVLEKKVQNA